MLDTGTTQPFVSYKLAAKLPATVQTTMPLTLVWQKGKTMVATLAIQLDTLIDIFFHIILLYITTCKSFNIG